MIPVLARANALYLASEVVKFIAFGLLGLTMTLNTPVFFFIAFAAYELNVLAYRYRVKKFFEEGETDAEGFWKRHHDGIMWLTKTEWILTPFLLLLAFVIAPPVLGTAPLVMILSFTLFTTFSVIKSNIKEPYQPMSEFVQQSMFYGQAFLLTEVMFQILAFYGFLHSAGTGFLVINITFITTFSLGLILSLPYLFAIAKATCCASAGEQYISHAIQDQNEINVDLGPDASTFTKACCAKHDPNMQPMSIRTQESATQEQPSLFSKFCGRFFKSERNESEYQQITSEVNNFRK